MKKYYFLVAAISALLLSGAGCQSSPAEKSKLTDDEAYQEYLKVVNTNRKENIALNPLEYICGNEGCSIPEVYRRKTTIDPSNSTCIWTIVCGSGQIPDQIIKKGTDPLSSREVCGGVESLLCQNFSGEIYYGKRVEGSSEIPITKDDESDYYASAIQSGGVGSRLLTKSASRLDGEGYLLPVEDYVFTSFNSPVDILWVDCKEGYKAVEAKSPTGNKPVISGTGRGYGIEIFDQLKNQLVITCKKE